MTAAGDGGEPLVDACTPPAVAPPPDAWTDAERAGVAYRAARWTPATLARLAGYLADEGAAALATVSDARLLAAWSATVETFRDPASPARRRLDRPLTRLCRLSPPGLAAGLEAVLGGVRGGAGAANTANTANTAEAFDAAGGEAARATAPAARVVAAAAGHPAPPRSPILVVLAANLPALAVQPLLPALALRRPVLLKSPSAEPLVAPAFVAELARREPALGEAIAALTWPGGAPDLEAPLLAAAGRVVAYGDRPALDDLDRRAPGKLLAYGPKTSLAVVGADADAGTTAAALAPDVALFDQRGCLSVAAVYTAGDAEAFAAALASALSSLADRWPPGPPTLAEAAAVRQLREEAVLRGLRCLPVASTLAAGTVVVDPDPAFRPTPGLRTVRVHPLPDLARLPTLLTPWQDRLQGAALAGASAQALEPSLRRLGLSRFAPPGELQSPDATWHNGGIDPLPALQL